MKILKGQKAYKKFYLNTGLTVIEKDADDDSDTIKVSGYASTNDIDRDGDIIEASAWGKPGALKGYLKNPIILAYHDHTQPIGKMVDYTVDSKGLRIVAEISKAAGKVYNLVKSGILKTFSVGFMINEADYDSKANIFLIKEVELFETSIVSVPANASATFSVSKSFETVDEYKNFKQQFETIKEENDMPDGIKNDDNIVVDPAPGLSTEDVAAIVAKALADDNAEKEAVKEAKAKAAAEVSVAVKEATDRLEADMADRLDAASKSEAALAGTIKELTDKVGEQGEALKAAQKNKMRFNGESMENITAKERDEAILLSKCLDKTLADTKAGAALISKAAPDSEGSNVPSSEWETLFNTGILTELREELKLEPMFTQIAMPTSTYKFPVNPEATEADWVVAGAAGMKSKTREGSEASSGTAVDHTIKDITLISKKLATKSFIGYEEEEDAILPIMPIIREALIRRMARASDKSLLMGTDAGFTNSGAGIQGLLQYAGATTSIEAATTSGKLTATDLMANRARLGRHGLDLSKLVHLVDITQYFNLMSDEMFLTMDKAGPNATLFKGQVGMVSGVPVVVTEAFPAAEVAAITAATVYTPNFLLGTQKGLTVESDKRVLEQDNLLIATRRFDFQQIQTGVGAQFLAYKA